MECVAVQGERVEVDESSVVLAEGMRAAEEGPIVRRSQQS